MPAFAQHPFSFGSLEPAMPDEFKQLPPEVQAFTMEAMKAFYTKIIRLTEDAGESTIMALTLEDGPLDAELSVGEIEAFQMGAMLAVSMMLEQFMDKKVIDNSAFFTYLRELLEDARHKSS